MCLPNKLALKAFFLTLASLILAACGSGNEKGFKEAVDLNAQNITQIRVDSENERVREGETEQYTAYGIVGDGSTEIDITSSVTWKSSDSAIVKVNQSGLATGVSNGTADIIASISDLSATKSLRSSDAALISIQISNNPDNVPVCQTYSDKLIATGTYADGDQALISDKVTWNSSAPSSVYIGNDEATNSRLAKGMLSGLSLGTSTITATQGDVQSSGVDISVVAGLSEIVISSASELHYAQSDSQFTATGTYNSAQVDITENVSWDSSDSSILSFSQTNIGQAQMLLVGQSDISAICAAGTEGEVRSDALTVDVKEPVTVTSLRVVLDGMSYSNEETITLDLSDSPKQLKLNTVDSANNQGSEDLADKEETTWTVIGSPLSGEAPSISSDGEITFDVIGQSEYQVRYKDDDKGINVLIGFFIKVE